MDHCFDENARKDLRKALSRHGCRDADAAASAIEHAVQSYYRRFIAVRNFPSIIGLGEAVRILDRADSLCQELDGVGETTRRLMSRELEARKQKMSLGEYGEAVNDVCASAMYAMQRAARETKHSDRSPDKELRRLVATLMKLWRHQTGGEVPKLPSWAGYLNRNWRFARRLEEHPVWIVARALGIHLNSYGVLILIESGRAPDEAISVDDRMVPSKRGDGAWPPRRMRSVN